MENPNVRKAKPTDIKLEIALVSYPMNIFQEFKMKMLALQGNSLLNQNLFLLNSKKMNRFL